MPKSPDYLRYNEILAPIVIAEIIKEDAYFLPLFTSVSYPTFKIYPTSLFNKDTTWIDGFLQLDGVTPIKRAMAVYCPNDIAFKSIAVDKKESYPSVWIEVGIQIQAVHLQEKARNECLLLCKDIEYTIETESRNLSKLITNPFTNIDEHFQIARCQVINISPLQMGVFNNNLWTCITLIELQVCTT